MHKQRKRQLQQLDGRVGKCSCIGECLPQIRAHVCTRARAHKQGSVRERTCYHTMGVCAHVSSTSRLELSSDSLLLLCECAGR